MARVCLGMTKKINLIIIGTICIVLIGGSGFYYFTKHQTKDSDKTSVYIIQNINDEKRSLVAENEFTKTKQIVIDDYLLENQATKNGDVVFYQKLCDKKDDYFQFYCVTKIDLKTGEISEAAKFANGPYEDELGNRMDTRFNMQTQKLISVVQLGIGGNEIYIADLENKNKIVVPSKGENFKYGDCLISSDGQKLVFIDSISKELEEPLTQIVGEKLYGVDLKKPNETTEIDSLDEVIDSSENAEFQGFSLSAFELNKNMFDYTKSSIKGSEGFTYDFVTKQKTVQKLNN